MEVGERLPTSIGLCVKTWVSVDRQYLMESGLPFQIPRHGVVMPAVVGGHPVIPPLSHSGPRFPPARE